MMGAKVRDGELYGNWPNWVEELHIRALQLQQVLIKPRKIAAVHWRHNEGGLLSLVNTCGETVCRDQFP